MGEGILSQIPEGRGDQDLSQSRGSLWYQVGINDLTFTVAVAPTTAQAYSSSAATVTVIPEDPTIKGVFADSGARMQVLATAGPYSVDTVTAEIPKSQVATLDQKGTTIVDQGGNYYSMSAMTLSTLVPTQCRDSGVYSNNLNG